MYLGTVYTGYTAQALSLVVNIGSYFFIEMLRGNDGLFNSSDYDTAKGFEKALYISLGVFALSYLTSVIHGRVGYKRHKTKIGAMITAPDGTGYMTWH